MGVAVGLLILILVFNLLGILLGILFKVAVFAGVIYLGYTLYQKYIM